MDVSPFISGVYIWSKGVNGTLMCFGVGSRDSRAISSHVLEASFVLQNAVSLSRWPFSHIKLWGIGRLDSGDFPYTSSFLRHLALEETGQKLPIILGFGLVFGGMGAVCV